MTYFRERIAFELFEETLINEIKEIESVVTINPKVQCHVCRKTFLTKTNFSNHLKTHQSFQGSFFRK